MIIIDPYMMPHFNANELGLPYAFVFSICGLSRLIVKGHQYVI